MLTPKKFDNKWSRCYNTCMMKIQRKRRVDRSQLIYVITNMVTGDQYIGLTALNRSGSVVKTLKRRMQKHMQRALTENKSWGLCEDLRSFGSSAFTYGLVEKVRGKAQAHVRELDLIREFNPVLNTFR